MLVAWPAGDHAVVLAVGPHGGSTEDIYDALLGALGLVVAPGSVARNTHGTVQTGDLLPGGPVQELSP
jgi:hypothetical protein